MKDSVSELAFAAYLERNRIAFDRSHVVDPSRNTNVDFLLHLADQDVLADVKEVRDAVRPDNRLAAGDQIRGDVHKLRQKFTKAPELALILVTVNRGRLPFTGFTVVTAMLGRPELVIHSVTGGKVWPLHHAPKGNATFTREKNRCVSGILVFQPGSQHHFYANPYAAIAVLGECLPDVTWHHPRKDATEEDLMGAVTDWFPPVLLEPVP